MITNYRLDNNKNLIILLINIFVDIKSEIKKKYQNEVTFSFVIIVGYWVDPIRSNGHIMVFEMFSRYGYNRNSDFLKI